MNRGEHKPSQNLEVFWPPEDLAAVTVEPKHPTAVIFSVESVDEIERCLLTNGSAVRLAEAGVELFALIGNESEQAHDALDWMLEEVGLENVLTSWHDQEDSEDLAWFVVATSRANGLTRILAVLDESTENGIRLRHAIEEAMRVDADE